MKNITPIPQSEPCLVLVVHIQDQVVVDEACLRQHIQEYQNDDFLDPGTVQGIAIILSHGQRVSLQSPEITYLRSLGGVQWLGIQIQASSNIDIPQGPYLFMNQCVWKVFKLYADTNSAFLTTLSPMCEVK